MKSDYHIHSEFSDDSTTTMEQQIEQAIRLGLSEMCFTDHVDYGIKKDWNEEDIQFRGGDGVGTDEDEQSPITNVNYPEYFLKIDRMRKTYPGKIQIRGGLEFGIQTETIPQYKKLVETYDEQLDFILLSIHQIGNKEFWNGDFQKGKTEEEYVTEYYRELLNIVKEYDDYDVLAHVDLITRYDPEGPYPFEKIKGLLEEIFTIIIHKGKGIEINTSSWHYGLSDTTPSKDILSLYHSLGGTVITIGSDAHSPQYLADHFEDAQRILKEIGFEEFYTFEKRKAIPHKL